MHVILDPTLERLGDQEKLRPLTEYLAEYDANSPVVYHTLRGTVGHDNYLGYLAEAWNNHLGFVIKPDYLWNMVASEIAIVVRDNPEHFRDLFSTSDETVEITVVGCKAHHLIYGVSAELKKLVPTDTSAFIPEFTTTSDAATFAHLATFLDTVSPYYSYSMLLCGFPSVMFRGTPDDWFLFRNKLSALSDIFKDKSAVLVEYLAKVAAVVANLQDIADNLHAGKEADTAYLSNIMALKRCGSGHQVEVEGWIRDFYVHQPRPAYVGNFSRHIAVVNYKDLSVSKNYRIFSGLLSSEVNGDILWPTFSFIQTEAEDDA
ncbi:MAG: DUF4419 domain-containing protein [Aestuariibacter sp.]|nr:DUF4419 domain-containing protein [Aestuariibacter sp.]|tara:strand:+ start:110477 stop:111430 length:954 start_codon:yes stop_codon:yes gene_type:complete